MLNIIGEVYNKLQVFLSNCLCVGIHICLLDNFLDLICRSYILQMAYNLNIGTLYIHFVTDIVWLLIFYYKLQNKIVCGDTKIIYSI